MTKKFLSFVLTIACSLLLGSCENSEGLIIEDSKLDMSLFSHTYTIDDEDVVSSRVLSQLPGAKCKARS